MIIFVTSAHHKYALRPLKALRGAPEIQIISYNRLFKLDRFRKATYIFCDFDRLNFWELDLAAKVHRQLSANGCRVLNDPARALQRFSLLRKLQREGLNSFHVWDAAIDPLPDRFPVFLRTKAGHRGTLTDLLGSEAEAREALTRALDDGINLHDLMFVEYCAEPIASNVFRKLSAFVIGDQIVTGMAVHDATWHAKFGAEGIAGECLYKEEYEIVDTNEFAEQMLPVFRAANIEFGRADFSMVDGQLETYEINTNPSISPIIEHPFDIRVEADRLHHERLLMALAKLDEEADGRKTRPVRLDIPELAAQKRRDRGVFSVRWTP
ncbi:MAG: hypothetical protein AAF683_10420 [Pseudomonadota bacterium]